MYPRACFSCLRAWSTFGFGWDTLETCEAKYCTLCCTGFRRGCSHSPCCVHGQVPELSAFILVTFFPQLPIVIVLGVIQVPVLPIEIIMSMPFAVLLVRCTCATCALPACVFTGCSRPQIVEMFLSYKAVRALIATQTAQFFRLCQQGVVEGEEPNPMLVRNL